MACCATAAPTPYDGCWLPATGDAFEGGWQLPRDPRVVVDHDYVLAAAGLLAEEHPVTAHRLVSALVTGASG